MRKGEIVKNVSSSWFSLGINILVGIFLSPFILHHLGNVAYGAWVLAFSVTGYYGLFDLGIRSSIIRYVSTYSASHDVQGLTRLINTSLALYTVISMVAMIITLVLSVAADSIFRIPPDLVVTARWLLLMVGAAVSFGFPAGVFGGALEGLNRFYVVNLTNLTSTLLRAILIILALTHGYGLLMVAFITVVLPLVASAVRAFVALKLLRVPLGWRYVNRSSLGEIFHYSSVAFIIMIAYKLRFKTDELIISTFLSITAVTFFSNADRLVDYTGEVVSSLAQIFVPMSGRADAIGDISQLRRIFVAGNRACAFIVFPITATLIILGKSVITAWVGASYVAPCYPVMLILLIPSTFTLAQAASPRILFGMAKHKTLAWVVAAEGIANIILSIILIRPYGIIGDALGTAIPLCCTTIFFMPRHLCRVLDLRLQTFLRQAYLLPLLLCLPTVATLLLMRRWFFAHTYPQVGLQILIGLLPYMLGLAWATKTKHAWRIAHLAPSGHGDNGTVAIVSQQPQSSVESQVS
jgi:O-antigen/teichoic acid export membrane protein